MATSIVQTLKMKRLLTNLSLLTSHNDVVTMRYYMVSLMRDKTGDLSRTPIGLFIFRLRKLFTKKLFTNRTDALTFSISLLLNIYLCLNFLQEDYYT